MSEVIAIKLPIDAICEYRETQPIERLSLFGSALRDELTEASDIDLLVDYLPGASVGLFTMSGHRLDLIEIAGRAVDLATPNSLSPYVRQAVLESAKLDYAKAHPEF